MKIVKLSAENIKRLRAVEITPTGEIVTIAGKNDQGKTSILDSIYWALRGGRNIQDMPIRTGETRARIRLDLGEIVVERKFNEHGNTLTVESDEGARFQSPQKLLDAIVGELSFDPLAFARMDPRKQFDELRRIAKVDCDIEKLDGLNRADYDLRTGVNREAAAKKAQADGVSIPADPGVMAVDEAAIVEDLQKAGVTNTKIERMKGERASMLRDLDATDTQAAKHRDAAIEYRRLADLADRQFRAHSDAAMQMRNAIASALPLPEPVDLDEIVQRLNRARIANAATKLRQEAIERRDVLRQAAKESEAIARAITENMAAREATKRDAIAAATLPIAGLGFGDGAVTFNGIPFEQASSSEQLRVSMAIAMASNPKLRVIRITDGSLLDEDSLAEIGAMAKEHDTQVWIEQVSSDGKVGIVIEDGRVVSTPESRANVDKGGING